MARRKKKLSPIYVVSLGAHLVVGGALALIPKQKLREVVAIALNEAPPPKDEPKPPPPPKPQPPPDRPARSPRSAAHEPVEAAQPSAANAAQNAFTDLGLTLDSSSSDGLAVPVAAKAVAPPAPAMAVTKPKVLVAKRTEPECDESLVKARPLSLTRPSYTDEARRARVEGRVRIELSVNDHGQVTGARVLDGLGYGLDEAALAAARDLRFEPALLCRRPVAAPFVIAMRFVLGS